VATVVPKRSAAVFEINAASASLIGIGVVLLVVTVGILLFIRARWMSEKQALWRKSAILEFKDFVDDDDFNNDVDSANSGTADVTAQKQHQALEMSEASSKAPHVGPVFDLDADGSPSVAPPPSLLPEKWAEYMSPEGRPYWHNMETDETTWDRPAPAPPAPPSAGYTLFGSAKGWAQERERRVASRGGTDAAFMSSLSKKGLARDNPMLRGRPGFEGSSADSAKEPAAAATAATAATAGGQVALFGGAKGWAQQREQKALERTGGSQATYQANFKNTRKGAKGHGDNSNDEANDSVFL
jgi:hypothetical protein